MYCRIILPVLLFIFFAQTGIFAQADFREEIEKALSHDPEGKFLYDHSDAYHNRIEARVKKIFLAKEHNEILSADYGKDVYYDSDDQNETTIAINRKNANLIIAGSNDGAEENLQMPVYISKDAGASWHTARLPTLPEDRTAAGDPAIAASDDGRFYYAFLTNPKYAPLPIQLVVAVSVDGENWTDMQPVGIQKAERSFQDKPTITVDNSPLSPHYGRVYTSWTLMSDDKPYDGLRLSWSDDGGKSWSPTKVLSTGSDNTFAQLCTGKNGEILVSYSSLNDSLNEVLVSKDGAETFDNLVIAKFIPFPLNSSGRPSLKGHIGFRAYSSPSIRVDLKTNRLHVVYGTWKVWSLVDSSAELLYTYSDDMGLTWNAPVIVGESENVNLKHRDRFFPWFSYDEFTHETSLVYYSSENDSNNIETTIYRSGISGSGLSNAIVIGDSLFNPLYSASLSHGIDAFIGDYIGCDAYKNRLAAAWTQNRPNHNDGDVFAFVGTTDSSVSGVNNFAVKLNADKLWLSNVYPNPSQSNHAMVNYTIPQAGNIKLDVISESGNLMKKLFEKKIAPGSYSEELNLEGIPSGFFILRISTQSNSVDQSFTIIR